MLDKPGKRDPQCPYCHGTGLVKENGRYDSCIPSRCPYHDEELVAGRKKKKE